MLRCLPRGRTQCLFIGEYDQLLQCCDRMLSISGSNYSIKVDDYHSGAAVGILILISAWSNGCSGFLSAWVIIWVSLGIGVFLHVKVLVSGISGFVVFVFVLNLVLCYLVVVMCVCVCMCACIYIYVVFLGKI